MKRRDYLTRGCVFTKIKHDPEFDAEDLQAIGQILEHGEGHHAIASALQEAGVNVSEKTVERHRRELCSCRKVAAWVL